jgi:hypothetical protein
MSKTKRSKDSKRKATHYGLMVKHAKKSMDKKRMELFRKLMEEKNKIAAQSDNIVNADDVGVDVDVDIDMDDINQIVTDAIVEAVDEPISEVEIISETTPSVEG